MFLTSISPVYSLNPSVRHIRDSLLCFLFDSCSGSVLSGVMGLISELKSGSDSVLCNTASTQTEDRKRKNNTSDLWQLNLLPAIQRLQRLKISNLLIKM